MILATCALNRSQSLDSPLQIDFKCPSSSTHSAIRAHSTILPPAAGVMRVHVLLPEVGCTRGGVRVGTMAGSLGWHDQGTISSTIYRVLDAESARRGVQGPGRA